MEGMEAAAAEPAGGSPQVSKTGSKTASPMHVTSAMERNGLEPQPDNGPLPRPWPCPQENRPSLMAPQPPRAWGLQLQGPSVLESKVRALKEKMTAGKQGASPCPISHKRSSPKKSRCQRVKAEGFQTPSGGSPLPDAVVVPRAQNLTDGQLDSSIDEEEPTRKGGSRPSRSPAPGLECQEGQSPWPPEAAWMLPDHEKGLLPGPSCLQESPIHSVPPGQPWGPGPCKITHMPSLKKGRPSPPQDGLVTGEDLNSTSLPSEEDLAPRTALLGGFWRTRDLEVPGTGGSALSLSDRVERNRLVLQEMLKLSGQTPAKTGSSASSSSWDRAAPERPVGDMDWDSGISLQDLDPSRTFGPKLEPVLSTRHEETKHLLQCARMKARTQPLRASHDIVPTIAQGSRDGRRSPGLDPRTSFCCRDSPQNGNVSDSSSGESGSGRWPRRGIPLLHVRFEDESAPEAESRYLQRLQQRQRQVPSTALQAAAQGPLRSKPDLAHYIHRGAGQGVRHRPDGGLGCGGPPAPPASWDSERRCRACGTCLENRTPAEGKAAPDPRVLQADGGVQGLHSSHGLGSPLGLHTEWIRETHIGEATTSPEEGDSALDSTDTSDSEEAGTPQPNRAGGRPGGSSPRQRDSRPRGGHRWPRKAQHLLPGADDVATGIEVKGGRGHRPEGTPFPREDAVPKPPVLEPERAPLGSQRQHGPGLGGHRAHPVDSWAPRRAACATASSMEPGPSGPSRPDQIQESHKCPEMTHAASLQQSHMEPPDPHPAQQLTASLSPAGWVPTPPPSRTTAHPVPHRKAAPAGPHRPGDQGEPVDVTLPLSSPRTMVLSPPQPQPCSPQVRHPLLDLSTNDCNSRIPLGLQEPWGAAVHRSRAVGGPCGQELELSLESNGRGGLRGAFGSADVTTINSSGITLSLASEEPESSQEPQGSLQRTESSSGGHMPPGASPGASAGPTPPSAAPSDGNKKRSSSFASTLGLKKLFSALGHASRPKLGKSRSYSVEQLQPAGPGPTAPPSTPKAKRAPSLQSLHLVSPSHQHRKAASFQNLHSLLSSKGDRSSVYLVEGPGDPSVPGRPARAPARRALSVDDVSGPSLARTVGRVVAVFPDGTSQLQLQRPPEGTFGFCVAYGSGRRDSGLYVQEMADSDTAKLYSGLLGVGDEILEVDGAKVAGLGLAHIKSLLAQSESLSIRVLRQRPVPR